MRTLYYNWVDYLDDEGRGGGVSVYQANLLRRLEETPGVEAVFLSSGLAYDLRNRTPRWEPLRHGPGSKTPRFEIVNSGCLSPSHHSFGNDTQVAHPETELVFSDFLQAQGPFDVVHFNNLEGVPANVLALRATFPDTRFVLSLHNYYPVCPQVNLWFGERENCLDFEGGSRCIGCLEHKPAENLTQTANGLAYWMKVHGIRAGTWQFDLLYRSIIRAGSLASRIVGRMRRRAPVLSNEGTVDKARGFVDRRAAMVRLINENCDRVLAVSDRVGEIAVAHGIDQDLVRTSYIGSAQAEKFAQSVPRGAVPGSDGTVTLGYLGYMRRDKGFFFLLDALEKLPKDIASRVRLLVAAKIWPDSSMARLDALKTHLAGVTHVNGYGHGDLDDLLARVDVGLIPVMWQDNLPQVAIEMHARHIPLLTSDLGGAQELGRCPDMVFQASSTQSFTDRLRFLLDGKFDPDRYWQGAMAPISMDAHVRQLLEVYRAV